MSLSEYHDDRAGHQRTHRGACAEVFEHCARQHTLVTSDFILNELRKHLTGKFNYSSSETREAIALMRSRMEVVTPNRFSVAVCRDPDDNVVLRTALAGTASCIITGDKDLLVLRAFEGIDIVHPSAFAEYEATQERMET